ncbi:trichohyalin isoform X2 [Orussus abietinus]|uniref:trichohyalin isoform X2 n=1 Tax=Orussus abietinus TaxID=222816 RepID=UPI000C715D1F|nr:trichohyalin isoform X2 [Orussus abietinus]
MTSTMTTKTMVKTGANDEDSAELLARTKSKPVARKRQLESSSSRLETPRKNPRHDDNLRGNDDEKSLTISGGLQTGTSKSCQNDELIAQSTKGFEKSKTALESGSIVDRTDDEEEASKRSPSNGNGDHSEIEKVPQVVHQDVKELLKEDAEKFPAARGDKFTAGKTWMENGRERTEIGVEGSAREMTKRPLKKLSKKGIQGKGSENLENSEKRAVKRCAKGDESNRRKRNRSEEVKRPQDVTPSGRKPEESRQNVDRDPMKIPENSETFMSENSTSEKLEQTLEREIRGDEDDHALKGSLESEDCKDLEVARAEEDSRTSKRPVLHVEGPRREVTRTSRRDDSERLRKTISWLEEGARRMREDLASTRAELHEERRAARIIKREMDTAVREARNAEAAKYQLIVTDLKTRLSQSPSRSTSESSASTTAKAEMLKEENRRREMSALKNRLGEAEATVRKLKADSLDPGCPGKRRKLDPVAPIDLRKLEADLRDARRLNKSLEEKLHVVSEAERARAADLRAQHERHEAELVILQRTLRADTIKMMDELKSKDREIEKLEKLLRELQALRKKSRIKDEEAMRKLRESERSHQIRLAPRLEEKIPRDEHATQGDCCKGECDSLPELERLRELAVEQQEVIEVLRQAIKEKERKLDQLSNKKRKEEFYRQWLELEPVAEVDDEEEHEEGDSALSSAPSSLSPQPGGCGQWQANGVTREAYEAILLEVEEFQTKLLEERQELNHAKSQVRDLEKALLQETRGSQNSRRALSDKLREAEEREASLVAEISELREQNELLEFRVLELEETPCLRDTPDPADSGIVSPEPIHLYKEQLNKHRDRAIATVIPYSTYTRPVSSVPQKPALSLQESGIFEEEDEVEVELASRGTQTEVPAGELLQEVQRLQELRARIQERAVKVPVMDTKSCSTSEIAESSEISQLAAQQERIRDLEERLSLYEEAEESRSRERQISKQREEELLDENYRLTERVYWCENEIRGLTDSSGTPSGSTNEVGTTMEGFNSVVDQSSQWESLGEEETRTPEEKVNLEEDAEVEGSEGKFPNHVVPPLPRCQKMFRDLMKTLDQPDHRIDGELKINGGYDFLGVQTCTKTECTECKEFWRNCCEKVQELTKTECSMRGRIEDLERRERIFAKTLRQADKMWSQVEAGYVARLKEVREQLEEKVEVNRRLLQRFFDLEEEARTKAAEEDGGSEKAELFKEEMDVEQREELVAEERVEAEKSTSFITVEAYQVSSEDMVDGPEEKSPLHRVEISRSTQTEVAASDGCWCSGKNEESGNTASIRVSTLAKKSEPAEPTSRVEESSGFKATNYSCVTVMVLPGDLVSPVPEVATEAKEETVSNEDPKERTAEAEEEAAVVTFSESEPEKKVRPRESMQTRRKSARSRQREIWEGWAMRTWNAKGRSGDGFREDSRQRRRRWVLYQEICV